MEFIASALSFLLPFERIPSFQFHGITLRASSFVLLLFILIGIPFLFKKKKLLPLSAIDKSILFYYGAVILSVVFATPHKRPLAVAGFLAFTISGYLLISRVVREKPAILPKLIKLIIVSAAVTAIWGLFQFFGDWKGLPMNITGLAPQYTSKIFGFARIQSVGLEPLYYANYLLLPIFLLVSSMVFLKKKPDSWKMITLALLLTVFILTLSRGAYIAISVCTVAFLITCLYTRKYRYTNLIVLIGLAALSGLLAWGSIKLVSGKQGTQNFTSHATVTDAPTASVNPRLENYKEAWRLFETAPVFGIGIGNYGALNTVNKGYEGYQIVNNQYLETLCETGIVGLLALAYLAYNVLAELIQRIKKDKEDWFSIALFITVLGIGTQYNFFSTIYILFVWFVIGLVDGTQKGLPGIKKNGHLPD